MPRKRRVGINEQVYRPADGKERDPEISAFKVLPAYYRTESAADDDGLRRVAEEVAGYCPLSKLFRRAGAEIEETGREKTPDRMNWLGWREGAVSQSWRPDCGGHEIIFLPHLWNSTFQNKRRSRIYLCGRYPVVSQNGYVRKIKSTIPVGHTSQAAFRYHAGGFQDRKHRI